MLEIMGNYLVLVYGLPWKEERMSTRKVLSRPLARIATSAFGLTNGQKGHL